LVGHQHTPLSWHRLYRLSESQFLHLSNEGVETSSESGWHNHFSALSAGLLSPPSAQHPSSKEEVGIFSLTTPLSLGFPPCMNAFFFFPSFFFLDGTQGLDPQPQWFVITQDTPPVDVAPGMLLSGAGRCSLQRDSSSSRPGVPLLLEVALQWPSAGPAQPRARAFHAFQSAGPVVFSHKTLTEVFILR
jgi:hypothetical protein